jgi:hypothetical protein
LLLVLLAMCWRSIVITVQNAGAAGLVVSSFCHRTLRPSTVTLTDRRRRFKACRECDKRLGGDTSAKSDDAHASIGG